MTMFIPFIRHFFSIIRNLDTVFLSLFALIVSVAVVVTHIEKMSFGEALYFSFITGLTIGYGDIVGSDVNRTAARRFPRTHRHDFYRVDRCRGRTCSR
jgi:hypothetical protein